MQAYVLTIAPTGLKLSHLGISYNRLSFSEIVFCVHNLLGDVSMRSYFENEPVLDSNQHILFESLVCEIMHQNVVRSGASLKTHSLVLSYSKRPHPSSHVYVDLLQLLIKHFLSTIKLFSLYILSLPILELLGV